jgi:hypothetical protein
MRNVYNNNVIAMEEGEAVRMQNEEPPPPPPPDYPMATEDASGIKVSVIKPFKSKPMVSRIVRQGKCFYHSAKPASYICSSCGKSVCSACTINFGGVFYCTQCAPPVPVERPVPQQPADYSGWYRAVFSIGLAIVIIGVLFALLYWPLTSMSAAEFENLEQQYQRDGGHNFEDYNPGDVIVIKDTIIRMEDDFDSGRYGVITLLWFESTGKGDTDYNLTFDGDLKTDYHVGDSVAITLHIDEDDESHNEIIREKLNDLPDISNIDHTVSIDMIFFAMVAFGAFLMFMVYLFMQKDKKEKARLQNYSERGAEGAPPQSESYTFFKRAEK